MSSTQSVSSSSSEEQQQGLSSLERKVFNVTLPTGFCPRKFLNSREYVKLHQSYYSYFITGAHSFDPSCPHDDDKLTTTAASTDINIIGSLWEKLNINANLEITYKQTVRLYDLMKESVELLQQLFQVGDNVDSKYAALADLEIDNKEEDHSRPVKKFQARLEYLSRICLYNIYLRTGKIEEKTGGRSKDIAAIQLVLKECDEISEISDCAFTLLLSKPLKSEKATNLYPLPVKALFEHLKKSVIQYNEQCKTNVDNCVQWIDKVSQQREVLRSQADEDSQIAKLYLEDILSFISHLDLVTSEFKAKIYKNMQQFHERCLVLAPKQETIGKAEKKKRLARSLQDFNEKLSSLESKINTIEGIVLVSDDQLGSRKEIEAYFDI